MQKLFFLAVIPILFYSPASKAGDLRKLYTMSEYCSMPYKMRSQLHRNELQPPIVPSDSACMKWRNQSLSANKVTIKIDPKLYEDFKISAKELSPADREKLKVKLEQKQSAEIDKKNNDAVIYYQGLLNILTEIQAEAKAKAKKSSDSLSENISDGKREPKLKEFDEIKPVDSNAKTIDR